MTNILHTGKTEFRRWKNYLLLLFALSLSLLAILYADAIRERMLSTLILIYKSLLPALFPFMIISSLSSHLLLSLEGKGERPKKVIFLLLFFMSIFFGFPIGAKMVSDLYNRKAVSKAQASRLFPLFNQTGFAFVCYVVGRGFLGSFATGCKIYCIMILSSLVIFLLFPRGNAVEYCTASDRQKNAYSLVSAVREASLNMLYIVGFVLTFSIPCALAFALCKEKLICALLCSLLEISAGSRAISELLISPLHIPLLCFCVSFGGICVGMQTEMCVSAYALSMKEYYKRKLFGAMLAFFLGFLI